MKLIDEATGKPPVLHQGDALEFVTDLAAGLAIPDSIDGDGQAVQLCRVVPQGTERAHWYPTADRFATMTHTAGDDVYVIVADIGLS